VNSPQRILIIEDNLDLQEAMSAVFELYGYRTFSALAGVQALTIVCQCHPDLICLDVCLPVMDGRQFLDAYLGSPVRHVPIIGISGRNPQPGSRLDGFLPKPYRVEELLALVHQLIGS
jgi:CheY-like chemotaxis protein